MSHPDGGMPQREEGLQIDLSKTDTIVCEECGNASFIQAFFLKKVSALVSPNGQEQYVPDGVFACEKCGHVNAEFENMETT